MARTRTDGFAQGFGTGFGLVNDIYKQRADEEYQEGVLDIRQSEADASKKYYDSRSRKENAEFDFLTKTDDDGFTAADREQNLKEETLRYQRDLAKQNLKTAKNKPQPNEEGLTPVQVAQIERDNAVRSNAQGEIDARDKLALDETNALHLQRMSQYVGAKDYEGLGTYIRANAEDLYDKRSDMNFMRLADPRTNDWLAALQKDLQGLASGELLEPGAKVSDSSLNSMSYLVHRNTMSYIGKEIENKSEDTAFKAIDPKAPQGVDQAFANVPQAWMNKGMVVTDAGLFDVETSPRGGGNIRATVWVKANDPDGNELYYTAPLTRSASTFTSEFQDISMNDGLSALAAQKGFMDYMTQDPALRAEMETAAKELKEGSVEKFNQTRNARVKTIMDYATQQEKDKSVDGIDLFGEYGIEGLTIGQIAANEDFVRQKVTETMLYGVTPESGRKKARMFFQKIDKQLPSVTFDLKQGGRGPSPIARRTRQQQGNTGTLDSIIDGGIDSLSQNERLSLFQLLDGNVMDQENFDEISTYLTKINKFKSPLGSDLNGLEQLSEVQGL